MDNRPLQFGSGTQLLGGSDALNQARARRQADQISPTSVVSPSAASFDPNMVSPAVPSGAPAPQPQAALAAPTGTAPVDTGALMGMSTANTSNENQLIIKALDSKLRSNAAIEKAQSRGGL